MHGHLDVALMHLLVRKVSDRLWDFPCKADSMGYRYTEDAALDRCAADEAAAVHW